MSTDEILGDSFFDIGRQMPKSHCDDRSYEIDEPRLARLDGESSQMRHPYDVEEVWRRAAGPDAAASLFSYLRDGIHRDVGCGLLTASIYDVANMRSRRVFSENVEAYPTGNFKRLDRNLYFETVLVGRKHFSSTTIEEIAEVFFDWEKIRDLGFESNLNIPAVASDVVIGSVNLLAKKGHYDVECVGRALLWQPIVTLCFLLLSQSRVENASFSPNFDGTDHPATEG
ncbi:hypothetical protein [Agrobacterium vitis]|uniref:hypothetical protein n=1 Tax=Agrobacterium vitis TaxID=373 RepID=UPI001F4265BB|nr:hypothetical protein [Agrobacterium vitis]